MADKIQKAYEVSKNIYDVSITQGNFLSRLYSKLFWSGTDDNDIARKVLSYIPDDFSGNLLDVPVGTAVFTKQKWAALKNAHITCLDYSEDMLEQAKKRLDEYAHIKCIQGDVGNLQMNDESFDVVVSMNGFHAFPDKQKAFQETWRVLKSGGKFIACYRLMKDKMRECFRTPESYNTLLYAMVNGHNRISELAAFSGYPKNKCDKYVKTLCEFGLVRKEPEKNGHTKYYPANSYISLWYKTLLTAVPNADGSFGEDVYNRFMQYFNDEILSSFYKDMCAYWLDKNMISISTDYIDTKDLNYRNVEVGNVTFDFACEKKRAVYAYYDTTPGGKLTQKLWKEIESSTTKDRPFYENEYVICTVNRVPDSYWSLSTHYDNVHIVKLSSLFATFNKDYNRRVHPRFVPSFV